MSVAASPRTAEIPRLTREVQIVPASLKEEDRSFEVVWTTGAEVVRCDWWTGRRYVESLSLAPEAVDLVRLNSGAPFLMDHSSWMQVGGVERGSARIENGQGLARVRLSRRQDPTVEGLWQDIRDGIRTKISVGYDVKEYEEEFVEGVLVRRTAIKWEPAELSSVSMPADIGAEARAQRGAEPKNLCTFVTRGQPAPAPSAAPPAPAAPPAQARAEAKPPAPKPAPKVPKSRAKGAVEKRMSVADLMRRSGLTAEEMATLIKDCLAEGSYDSSTPEGQEALANALAIKLSSAKEGDGEKAEEKADEAKADDAAGTEGATETSAATGTEARSATPAKAPEAQPAPAPAAAPAEGASDVRAAIADLQKERDAFNLERRAARIDKAIDELRLAPARRDFALSLSDKQLDTYLADEAQSHPAGEKRADPPAARPGVPAPRASQGATSPADKARAIEQLVANEELQTFCRRANCDPKAYAENWVERYPGRKWSAA